MQLLERCDTTVTMGEMMEMVELKFEVENKGEKVTCCGFLLVFRNSVRPALS